MPVSRPALVSLLGLSGSGKTTLAVLLVARWTAAGKRVGYVKHASHGFEMDRPGKDTDRVAAAGAAGIGVTGPGGSAYLERGAPAQPLDLVARFFADRDVVVLEGFRSSGIPAVVILGEQGALEVLAEVRGPVLAFVGAAPPAAPPGTTAPARVFGSHDFEGLAAHLERTLGL